LTWISYQDAFLNAQLAFSHSKEKMIFRRKPRRFKNVRTEKASSLERFLFFIRDKGKSATNLVLSLKYRFPLKYILGTNSDKQSKSLSRGDKLKPKRLGIILAFLAVAGVLLFIFIPRGEESPSKGLAPSETALEETLAPALDVSEGGTQDQTLDQTLAQTLDQTLAQTQGQTQGQTQDQTLDQTLAQTLAETPSATTGAGILTVEETPTLPMGILGYNAMEQSELTVYSAVIKEGGTISQALEQLGISRAHANAALSIMEREQILQVVRPGAVVKAYFGSPDKNPEELIRIELYQDKQLRPTVLIPGGPNGFIHYSTSGRSLELYEASEGKVKDTFWSAALQSGLDPRVIMNLTVLLASQIDFAGGVIEGDNFQLLFRARYEDGVLIDEPELEMIRVMNNDKLFEFFRQDFRDGQYDFFDVNFRSIKKNFLISPLQFTRISSGFSNARMHPIKRIVRPHKGVDYAAPIGTPVSAVADGIVNYAGNMGGYGITVVIEHKSYELTTMYAHLSRIEKGIRVGTQVKQGECIGYVGTTGLSTGPHLDFRLRRQNGEFLDPEVEFARQEGKELPPELQVSFAQNATARRERLYKLLEWSTF
jgi:murein DD-endopeptidase MepM/ murein hydrolase activator NlpD